MARLSWQNVDAPNLAPAMQGFANVTDLLQSALQSASTNPMLENQIKQEELNAKIRKAKNDANTLAANRAINAKVAMSPSAQALQQGLQNGSILGEDYLDASPEVISGARSAVGDMLTNSLNQDKVSALVPDKILAKLRATAPDAATFEKWRTDPTIINNEILNAASAEGWGKFGTGAQDLTKTSSDMRIEGQAVDAAGIKNRVDSIFGLALAGAGSETDIRNNAYALAKQAGFNGPELTELTNRLKTSDIAFADPIAQVPNTTGGKTGSTPASSAIAASIPIDNTGIDSGGFKLSRILPKEENRNFAPLVLSRVNGDLTGLSIDDKIKLILPALEFTESRGNSNAVSQTGARGLMQLMPATARELERKLGMKPGQTDTDPASNKKAGTYYFTELMKKYDGNEEYALAAYNAGPGTVDKAIKQQKDNPVYSNSQVSNVSNNASRAIAQFSADPIVLNHSALSKSTLTADQVALDGVKTSVDYGTLNKDEMDLAARNIKRTIEYVQKQAGGNISPELAFAVAKQSFGDENFRILWLNSDLNLNTPEMNKIIKSLNDKGGIPDQAAQLGKMTGVMSKFEAANANVTALEKQLIDAKRNNAGNPYSTVVSKAQSALDKALDIRTQIAKEIEKNPVFQPKENVTVEQKLTNAAEEKKALVDGIIKTKLDLKAADDFVRTGKRTPASDAVAQSLQVTNPADVKPVAAPIPVPVKVDGKSGTGTTFALDSKTGQAVPVTPLKLDPNVKYEKPVTVVKADRSGGAKAILYYVGDGDGSNITLSQVDANNLNNGKTDLACRMDTIDADETTGPGKSWPIDQPNGIQARDYLRNLIASGSVTVIVTKPAAPKGEPKTSENNYGRPLCKIEIEGVGIDMSMIKAGMATWYSQYSNDPALKAAEEKAKQDKVGRWKNPDVMNPADFRHGGWQQFLK
jgi:endonuclease YncB( thermonuclease family)